jgi:hypothetical protein
VPSPGLGKKKGTKYRVREKTLEPLVVPKIRPITQRAISGVFGVNFTTVAILNSFMIPEFTKFGSSSEEFVAEQKKGELERIFQIHS